MAKVVGTVASTEAGVLRVEAAPGWVTLARAGGVLPLSPNVARSLASLLSRAADVAERCTCVTTIAGERLHNPACATHWGAGR